MKYKLINGTKEDFNLVESLLRKIKKEAAMIFEEKFRKNELINYFLISNNTKIIGVFISVELSGEFINYLSLKENINDEIIFEEIYQNIRAIQSVNPSSEVCLNFCLDNSSAILFFQKKGIIINDASGYEMSISITNPSQFCKSRNLLFRAYDYENIDKYVEIENKAFAKLMNGKESISEHVKPNYANYLQEKNKINQFGAYEFENEIVGIMYMGNDYTIRTLAVLPKFQGRGFGKMIVFDWLNRYAKIYPEITEIKLHVDEKNKSAFNFYKKIGFKQTGSFSENTFSNKTEK